MLTLYIIFFHWQRTLLHANFLQRKVLYTGLSKGLIWGFETYIYCVLTYMNMIRCILTSIGIYIMWVINVKSVGCTYSLVNKHVYILVGGLVKMVSSSPGRVEHKKNIWVATTQNISTQHLLKFPEPHHNPQNPCKFQAPAVETLACQLLILTGGKTHDFRHLSLTFTLLHTAKNIEANAGLYNQKPAINPLKTFNFDQFKSNLPAAQAVRQAHPSCVSSYVGGYFFHGTFFYRRIW